jgi:hypothetical protein
MFVYNDSSESNYYLYRQRVYTMPSAKNKRLLFDFNKSCKMTTFLNKGDIFSHFGYRYLTFSSLGRPLDEIEFEGQPLKNKGGPFKNDNGQRFYAIYWQKFIMQNDTGINKKIFLQPTRTLEEHKEAYHQLKE